MNKIKKYILAFLLLELLLAYSPAYAQTVNNNIGYDYSQGGTNPVSSQIEKYLCAPTPVNTSQTSNSAYNTAGMIFNTTSNQQQAAANNANGGDLYRCINQIYKFAIVVASVAGVFMIVIAGYIYMSANGDSEAVNKAKSIIETTITAIVILLAGYVLLKALNPDLIQFQPIQPPSVVSSNAVGGATATPGATTPSVGAPTGAACGNTGQALCAGGTPDQSCTTTCSQYSAQIQRAIQLGGININGVSNPTAFIQSVMSSESGCNGGKTSSAGACGLVQLLPSTASQFSSQCGVPSGTSITCAWLNDSANSVASICMGAAYLQQLSSGICGANKQDIIAGYNGGSGGGSTPGACTPTVDCTGSQSCGGGNMEAWECPYADTGHNTCDTGYAQTRQYVPKVMSCYSALGGS